MDAIRFRSAACSIVAITLFSMTAPARSQNFVLDVANSPNGGIVEISRITVRTAKSELVQGSRTLAGIPGVVDGHVQMDYAFLYNADPFISYAVTFTSFSTAPNWNFGFDVFLGIGSMTLPATIRSRLDMNLTDGNADGYAEFDGSVSARVQNSSSGLGADVIPVFFPGGSRSVGLFVDEESPSPQIETAFDHGPTLSSSSPIAANAMMMHFFGSLTAEDTFSVSGFVCASVASDGCNAVAVVPEPRAYALLAAGLGIVAWRVCRGRHRSA